MERGEHAYKENQEFIVALSGSFDVVLDDAFMALSMMIPGMFAGTGDIFSAVFIGKLMSGKDLQTATAETMDAVKSMIRVNADNVDKYKGIPLETCLEVLD